MNIFAIRRQCGIALFVIGFIVIFTALGSLYFYPDSTVNTNVNNKFILLRTITIIGTFLWLVLYLISRNITHIFSWINNHKSQRTTKKAVVQNDYCKNITFKWRQIIFATGMVAVLAILPQYLKMAPPDAFDVIEHGSIKQLNRIVQQYPQILKKRNQQGMTLLMSAAKANRENIVDYLLIRGANVLAVDHDGRNVLFYAINNPRMFKKLLMCGTNLNQADAKGTTPLHKAIIQNCLETVHLLVEHGANVNARDQENRTPLLLAVQNNIDVVEYLLNNGADPDASDKNNWSALHYAARKDDVKTAQSLIKMGANKALYTNQDLTPLHIAAMNGSLQVMDILLKSGVDVNISNSRLQTPLDFAALKNKRDAVNMLLAAGANPNVKDNLGNTTLHKALLQEHYAIAEMLIKAGARLDITNSAEITAEQLIRDKQPRLLKFIPKK